MKNDNFFRCEFRFLLYLICGLVLLNIVALVLHDSFNFGLVISMVIGAIAVILYLIYFFYLLIKVKVFDGKYECQDVKQRLSGWFSSLIS